MKKNVVLGMSGGVDSAVSLYLLLQNKEYNVIPVFMKNWDDTAENGGTCSAEFDYADAKKVCDQLGVELHRVNFEKEYWNKVFTYFLAEYKKGRTPNPDIMCNKEIKFKEFLNYAINEFNADYVATGHYAQTKLIDGQNVLLRGNDDNKDQTYFLSQIDKNILNKVLFPVGHLNKPQVRELANNANLFVKNKKDSTGICFIGDENKFKDFLKGFLGAQTGNIVDFDGNVVGEHTGLMYYTIGQRRGLGIGGNKNSCDPWFVCGKNMEKNELIVVQGVKSKQLYSNSLTATDINTFIELDESKSYTAKFRYRQKDVNCRVKIQNDVLTVEYDDFSAITPGQGVVIYDGELTVCSGIIDKIYYNKKRLDYV